MQARVIAVDLSRDGIATLLGAVGDGLLMHALLDPELDVQPALDALRAMLAPRPS